VHIRMVPKKHLSCYWDSKVTFQKWNAILWTRINKSKALHTATHRQLP